MATSFETLLTTDVCGQLWNVCAWNPHSGTSTVTFRGGNSAAGTLCRLGNSHVISAQQGKPLIHVWPVDRKDQTQQKIGCVGCVTALACSPDGTHCVAAIADKIYIWQTSTGNLMAVLQRHYQTVRCLRFTDDGSHFVSGADDNLVLVWSLCSVLTEGTIGTVEPRHVWAHHSLPVTDVHVGYGGCRCRIFTSSRDMTVNLYELASGARLCTFVFDYMASVVITDSAESHMFVGLSVGTIQKVNLYEKPVVVKRHVSSKKESKDALFRGHDKEVSCLCCSLDGAMLVSGSLDASVMLWDVPSQQCIRTLPHKGAVTNVLLTPSWTETPGGEGEKRPLGVAAFKRSLHCSGADAEPGASATVTVQIGKRKLEEEPVAESRVSSVLRLMLQNVKEQTEAPPAANDEKHAEEIRRLRQINKEIYEFTVEKILTMP